MKAGKKNRKIWSRSDGEKSGFGWIFLVIWKRIYYNKRQRDGEKRDRHLPEMRKARILRRTVKRKQAVCEKTEICHREG